MNHFYFLYDDDDSVSNEFDSNLLKGIIFLILILFLCIHSLLAFYVSREMDFNRSIRPLEEEMTSGQVLMYSPGKMANQERP